MNQPWKYPDLFGAVLISALMFVCPGRSLSPGCPGHPPWVDATVHHPDAHVRTRVLFSPVAGSVSLQLRPHLGNCLTPNYALSPGAVSHWWSPVLNSGHLWLAIPSLEITVVTTEASVTTPCNWNSPSTQSASLAPLQGQLLKAKLLQANLSVWESGEICSLIVGTQLGWSQERDSGIRFWSWVTWWLAGNKNPSLVVGSGTIIPRWC